MPYATLQDMTDRFGEIEIAQLTDIGEVRQGGVVQAVLDRAIADADAEINAYLAARYPLPLPSVPLILTGLACEIVRYKLYRDAVPETVRDRYKAATKTLESIAAGKASLGLDASAAPAPVSEGVQFAESTRVFGRDVERITGAADG